MPAEEANHGVIIPVVSTSMANSRMARDKTGGKMALRFV